MINLVENVRIMWENVFFLINGSLDLFVIFLSFFCCIGEVKIDVIKIKIIMLVDFILEIRLKNGVVRILYYIM